MNQTNSGSARDSCSMIQPLNSPLLQKATHTQIGAVSVPAMQTVAQSGWQQDGMRGIAVCVWRCAVMMGQCGSGRNAREKTSSKHTTKGVKTQSMAQQHKRSIQVHVGQRGKAVIDQLTKNSCSQRCQHFRELLNHSGSC